MVSYMSIVPIQTVFLVSMRSHGKGAMKMESLQHIHDRDRQLLNYRLVLTSRQLFVIYDNLHVPQTND